MRKHCLLFENFQVVGEKNNCKSFACPRQASLPYEKFVKTLIQSGFKTLWKTFFCLRCLNHFYSKENLSKHLQYCEMHNFVKIVMAKKVQYIVWKPQAFSESSNCCLPEMNGFRFFKPKTNLTISFQNQNPRNRQFEILFKSKILSIGLLQCLHYESKETLPKDTLKTNSS